MRDHEYRGKQREKNEWVHGYLFVYGSGECDIYRQDLESEMNAYAVIPETVGQYTGLLDKNGVKIFEGDILLVNTARGSEPHYIKRIVEWKKPYYSGFVFDKGEYKSQYHEIIGNIHDNPELLHAN